MNRREIILQNDNINESIHKNIEAIKVLIEESDDIKKIVEKLKKQKSNKNIAQELELSLNNINTSIKKLLDQTNFLFDSYKKFIEFTFKK